MARIIQPSREQLEGWEQWIAGRSDAFRAVAERFEPWALYRLKTTGQRVTVVSFVEQRAGDMPVGSALAKRGGNVTVVVDVSGKFNRVWYDRAIYFIDPNDLEPCDLPPPAEALGTLFPIPRKLTTLARHALWFVWRLFGIAPNGKPFPGNRRWASYDLSSTCKKSPHAGS